MKNMEFIEYDNNTLIDFYIKNGLEFDENRGYFGQNVKSIALLENGIMIGAVTISIYQNKNFIEAIAVDKQFRNRGYGKLLLEKALRELSVPIYVISKSDEFYISNGFEYDNADLIGTECKTCSEYNVTCFPKVMVFGE